MSTPNATARSEHDAVVIGSGPNGLSAAIALAERGLSVLVLEGAETPGGGMRSAERTLPGFLHDVCSAVHPMGVLSPFWSRLPLADHGLRWCLPPVSAAHPLLDGRAALLELSLDETCDSLGEDAAAYRRLLSPFLGDPRPLVEDLLVSSRWPRQSVATLRFGLLGLRSASGLARARFRGELGKALLAGCAAHSILPLEAPLTAAMGLIFCLTGHTHPWPMVEGGTRNLARSLSSLLRALGGEIRCNHRVESFADLPHARAYLFDTAPRVVAAVCQDRLPGAYLRRLSKYRYGPGLFKIDFALRERIPWRAQECAEASTVHVGGTLDALAASEAAVWSGTVSERPFVMVCQQSHFDAARAPGGQHTGYAYIHVPEGWEGDCTETIVAQLEAFAPGFRDCILDQHVTRPRDLERYNPAFVGGAVTGGVADWRQMVTRPVARLDPYTTPDPSIFLCSAATPPGGGVHGLCGYLAARSVAARRFGVRFPPLASRARSDG